MNGPTPEIDKTKSHLPVRRPNLASTSASLSRDIERWKSLKDDLLAQMKADEKRPWILERFIPSDVLDRLNLRVSQDPISQRLGQIEDVYIGLSEAIDDIVTSAGDQIERHKEITRLVDALKETPDDAEAFNQLEEIITGGDHDDMTHRVSRPTRQIVSDAIEELKNDPGYRQSIIRRAEEAIEYGGPILTVAQAAVKKGVHTMQELRADRQLFLTIIPELRNVHKASIDILKAAGLNLTNRSFINENLKQALLALQLSAQALELAARKDPRDLEQLQGITESAQRLLESGSEKE